VPLHGEVRIIGATTLNEYKEFMLENAWSGRSPRSTPSGRLVLNKGPLKDGFDRPDGVLLFLGPTGVGKMELR
jgi:ATP-dependent Clp protease ATP-binding subunit ClpA